MDFATRDDSVMAQSDLALADDAPRTSARKDAKPAMAMDKASGSRDAGSAELVEALAASALSAAASVAAVPAADDSKTINARRFARRCGTTHLE